MSKEFAQSFFPSFISFVSSADLAPSFLVSIWDTIFPDDVATLCELPPQAGYIPRRPCLALASTVGACIGLRLGTNMSRRPQHHDDDAQSILAFAIHHTWSKSLTAFGAMNLAALLHHCIFPPPSSYQNDVNSNRRYIDNILWGADCIFTGVSSIHLTIMAWLIYSRYTERQNSTEVKSLRKMIIRQSTIVYECMISIAAILPILCQLFHSGHIDFWAAASTSIELIYLIPAVAAASSLFPLVVGSAFNAVGVRNSGSTTGARVAILGGILLVATLPLDASLCHFVSTHAPSIKSSPLLNDIYHLPTFIFLGCDIAFLGLDTWVYAIMHDMSAEHRKEL